MPFNWTSWFFKNISIDLINEDETSQSYREMFTIFLKFLKIHPSKAELCTIFGEQNFTYICERLNVRKREGVEKQKHFRLLSCSQTQA